MAQTAPPFSGSLPLCACCGLAHMRRCVVTVMVVMALSCCKKNECLNCNPFCCTRRADTRTCGHETVVQAQ